MRKNQWLLNPAAIKAARVCISAVKDELGVRLSLAHPDFLELLYEYSVLTDSDSLKAAYSQLVELAGDDVEIPGTDAVQPSKDVSSSTDERYVQSVLAVEPPADEWVTYHGKRYKRWLDNKEFKGLYRGQPIYS